MRPATQCTCVMQGAHRLMLKSALIHEGPFKEAVRQENVMDILKDLWFGADLEIGAVQKMDACVKLKHDSSPFLVAVLEFKDETYANGSGLLQAQRYMQVSRNLFACQRNARI